MDAAAPGRRFTGWCLSLTEQDYPGLIPLPALPGSTNFVYGGTPSDPSVVRCIRDLKARGFKVVFYPFLLGTGPGFPWRGRITSSGDLSTTATNDVATFMGPATVGDFTPDATNLTVAYSGDKFDWTYRRMILHYANLCTVAGGVNLFVIGSELRGLETLRGPAWTKAGHDRRIGQCDLGLSDGRGAQRARQRRAHDIRQPRLYARNTTTLENLICLLSRLVELDGLAAPRREAASGRTSINSTPTRTSTSFRSTTICR